MESYHRLIQRALGDGTPKDQYENLAFPKRGSSAEFWDIEDVSREAHQLLDDLKPK